MFLLIAAALVLGSVIGHNVNVYWGTNVGITWGHVGGIEFWGNPGDPGFFGATGD